MTPINIIRWIAIVSFTVIWIGDPAASAENAKKHQLERIMAEIALLNNQLIQRKTDAVETRGKLAHNLETIRKEALSEIGKKSIRDESEALSTPRIHYDLILMAEIQAYMDRYTRKINYYRIACDRLAYLYQQADDDLKIVNTLSDIRIDALMAQVEKVMDGYLNDAQTIIVQPDTLSMKSPEAVWNTLKSSM